ncbi:hypothetical protein HJC23_002272 [Cyclotella cryptica]|uniref:Calcineurin-like phosphoesterase domain-containing protein n=1 Tax=Cyclotella cryptica TaxID=29204 RepID=A0ABD3QGC7_9STRA
MICLLLISLPTLATAFAPTTTTPNTHMTNSPLARRTSSIAYDDQSHGPKYSFYGGDAWRKRRNLAPLNKITTPTFSFGIITDIQYAPIPDGHSYNGTPRYYRHAIAAAEHAARHFQREGVQCVVNLGDSIDGKCVDVERYGGSLIEAEEDGVVAGGEGEEKKLECVGGGGDRCVGPKALEDVLKALSCYTNGRIIHTYGNHELYNLSRKDLAKKLQIPFTLEPSGDLVGYYSHQIHSHNSSENKDTKTVDPSNKLRFLVLDSYDICLLDRCPQTSDKYRLARDILSRHNPNYPHEENSPEGLQGLSKRFVAFNGGIDTPQLEWFETSLQSARKNNERVIVVSHQPVHPESSWPTCLMWNYSDVLSIMRRYRDVIIASFSGHAHQGGYVRDEESGIHFRTLEAVLESPDPVKTYGIVDVWEDRVVVRGWGDCVSDVYDLDHLVFGDGENVDDSSEESELGIIIG